MWLGTVIMFVGSTAHYSVNWAQMLNTTAINQEATDVEWSIFYTNNVDFPSILLIPDLPIVLHYLPIVNVSLSFPIRITSSKLKLLTQYLLSDVIVFWRAWILWGRSRWVAALGALLITGTTGECDPCQTPSDQYTNYLVVSAILSARATLGPSPLEDRRFYGYMGVSQEEMLIGQWVVWSLSLASNISATALIGTKA